MSDEGVQHLVASCLDEADRFSRALVDRACDENPSQAAELRKRYEALRAAGLVAGGGSFVAEPDSWSDGAKERLVDPEAAQRFPVIGHYQPLRELGRGGQAVVYLAEDLRLRRPVALKVLKGLGPLSETMIRRFRREAEVASRLDHPGICAVFDAGVDDGTPYIAMRFIEGETLADRIEAAKERRKRGEETPSVGSTTREGVHLVLELIEKAARALHVAHEAGIVHRDVKPGNIMITPAGEPVLLDFGLAGDEDGDLMSLTGTGEALGTPAYMSPEQLQAKRIRVDRRADVYALGVTLFECLALGRPYGAGTREALYEAIRFQRPRNILELNPALPKDVKIIVETALEKDRDRRYRSAEALAEDLARARQGDPISARPVSALERALRWAKHRPVLAALVAVLVVGVPALAALIGGVVAGGPAILEARREASLAEIDGHLETGLDAVDRGDFGAALASFEKALELEPNSLEAVAGKALALVRLGHHEECLRFVARQDGRGPDGQMLRRVKLIALRGLGREGEAADLEKRTPAPASGAIHHFLLGMMLLSGDDSSAPETPVADGEIRPPELKDRYRAAYRHFLTASLSAPAVRKLYHLGMARAAAHFDDADATQLASFTMRTLWSDSRR